MCIDVCGYECPVKLICLELVVIDNPIHLAVGCKVDPAYDCLIITADLEQKDVQEPRIVFPQLHLDHANLSLHVFTHPIQLAKPNVRVKTFPEQPLPSRHLFYFVAREN